MQQVGVGVGYLGRAQATLQPDLTPSSGLPPVSPKASVMGSARRRRPVSPRRRSFGLKLGFIVFAGLSGAFAFSVLTDGGRHMSAMAPFFPEVDEVLYWTGLRIDQVTVSGQRGTPDADVFDALDLPNVRSLLSIDSGGARRRAPPLQNVAQWRDSAPRDQTAVWLRPPHLLPRRVEGRVLCPASLRSARAPSRR